MPVHGSTRSLAIVARNWQAVQKELLLRRCAGLQAQLEGRQFLGGEHPEKRLECDYGLPQTGVQVVVELVEMIPGLRDLMAARTRQMPCFLLQRRDNLRESSDFAEKAPFGAKEYVREQLIIAGNPLRVGAAEKAGAKGKHYRNDSEMATVLAHGAQDGLQHPAHSVEEGPNHCGLFGRRWKAVLTAQSKKIAQRDTGYLVGRLHLGADGFE